MLFRYKKLAKYQADHSIPMNAILNRRGEKLVHVAAKEGAVSCLEDLLERGAKVNLVDRRGNLPLHLAIQYCLGKSSLLSFQIGF
jgi:ankyrin repeat protein